jgi:hypothetical protein
VQHAMHTATPLPPCSGDDPRPCAKCRHVAAPDASYQTGVLRLGWDAGEHVLVTGFEGRECLLRTCLGCGWAWLEACADAHPAHPSDHQ